MPQKWNLQDIRPAGSGRKPHRERPMPRQEQDITPKSHVVHEEVPRHAPPITDPDLASIDIIDGGVVRKKRIMTSVIVGLTIIVMGFAVSVMMSGAEVTVYPKQKTTNLQANFTSYKVPKAGELSYELLTLEADGERQVSAQDKEDVSIRTTGTLFIYNEYSESPQRLIKNTRFETPEGLIFRIQESVEVPGYTKEASGSIAPGLVTAEVFAEAAGEEYNVSPTRFTIPGLKGTDQYTKMYAESTESFTGGFEGSRYVIEESELQEAKQALHLELRNALLERLETERPAGFVVYDGAVTFAFDSLPATAYGDGLATIKERARLQIPIFKEDEFAAFIAQNTIAGYEGELVFIEDPYALIFSYTGATTSTSDISGNTEMQFKLTGVPRIVWSFDEEALQSDLKGLAKTALPTVLSGYPSIERAEAVVRPFWRQSFPDDLAEIDISVIIGTGEEE